MKYSELCAEDIKFLDGIKQLRQHDRPAYISAICMLVHYSNRPISDFPEMESTLATATRGDFKRAIKSIRSVQAEHSDPSFMDDVVGYIRGKWLRKARLT